MKDQNEIRRIVKEEIDNLLFNQLLPLFAPLRDVEARMVKTLYGENGDKSLVRQFDRFGLALIFISIVLVLFVLISIVNTILLTILMSRIV